MQVTTGSRLGPYEILAPIGSGGMGEVFRARDTRLDRSVAIKVLPAQLAQNAQLKLRFEREARTISQLNHPHICALYDVGEGYLVMELLEGESLADRVSKGPLPMSEVLRLGAQIADALDRAHRAGIIHRDLKPGNVMLTKSGAKLLDFGLAKSGAIEISTDGATAHLPLTKEGTILGTFQYMAPEQLEGAEADARTDIFALGTVLYEMATGRRAFEGKTKTSLIAAIVSSDPKPISEVQPLTPPAFEHVMRKCLSKEPEDRWQSAHDIAEELRWISEAGSQAAASPAARRARPKRWLMWGAAAVAIAALIAAAAAIIRPRAQNDPRIATSITVPPHAPFVFMAWAALSPDGSRIAFVGYGEKESSLWVRPIDSLEARRLQNTEGAMLPFWSPDGTQIGFFGGGKLKRVLAAGGPPQVIADGAFPMGATWGADGTILFTRQLLGPIERIDVSGGASKAVTKLDPTEEGHRWPVFLPDGDHFLFLGDAPRAENHHIKIGSLKTGQTRILTQAVSDVRYAEPFVLFVRGGSLLAQQLDLRGLALTGEPRVLAEQVTADFDNHHHDFSASANGRLLYRSASPDTQLTWVDRTGKAQQTLLDPRRFGTFELSPSERTVIFEQYDADGRGDDIWLLDIARGAVTRFTNDPASDVSPTWSPDGRSIAFMSLRTGMGDLYIADAGNGASARLLTKDVAPTSWSPDGAWLLAEEDIQNDSNIDLVDVRTGAKKPYIATRFHEYDAVFSPDGKSVAYVSEESGPAEICVESFPSHAGRRQVSVAGGNHPLWRGDSKELYFVAPGGKLMALDTTSDSATPTELFQLHGNGYAPARDGRRFLVAQAVDDVNKVPLTFVSGALRDAK